MWTKYRWEFITAGLLAVIYGVLVASIGTPKQRDRAWHCMRLQSGADRCKPAGASPTAPITPTVVSGVAGSEPPSATPPTLPSDGGTLIRRKMVDACYNIVTFAYVLMIVQGYRRRSYGMPLIASATTLAICFVCSFVGPWSTEFSFLFYDAIKRPERIRTWRIWFVLQALVYIQYLLYSREETVRSLSRWVVPHALALLVVATFLEWQYIIFYQDFYVNESTCVVLLITALSYVHHAFTLRDVRGLSVVVGALLSIANTLLFVAMIWGGLKGPYPYKYFGYEFIHVLMAATLAFFYAYVLLLAHRRPIRDTTGVLDWLLKDLGLREMTTDLPHKPVESR